MVTPIPTYVSINLSTLIMLNSLEVPPVTYPTANHPRSLAYPPLSLSRIFVKSWLMSLYVGRR